MQRNKQEDNNDLSARRSMMLGMGAAIIKDDLIDPAFQAGVAPVFADELVNPQEYLLADVINVPIVTQVLVYQVEHVALVA